ncbi:UDP-3-O-[3-hydroxymyristoyl] glucosamine N-acyltransferase [Acidisarcina polymorpha]|uniref:UDP-3-O-acylglucosamine N-acyltransferase n=1 Tax=Acidisarcina polymorpha TaxID=2211140 RepID=A0A2Z5FW21_9BACT|nr:UDP-3-O-(3-hydroxymyristoyl)glucosamine N-acyltransferase [Acidisarcina polymorpha]AXC11031.1 UDP-3-O-[3-hydroxymyristoyl] glucosamine N-acyltransferase [Acidisarcina polymorpha]
MIPLKQLAELLELELRCASGDPETIAVVSVSSIAAAQPDSLVFATDSASAAAALSSNAAAVLLSNQHLPKQAARKPLLLSANPKLDFARAANLLRREERPSGIHPASVVDATASLATTASVAACAVIAAGAVVGERTVIGEGAVIGAGVTIGADCRIYPRVVLYPGTQLGDRVIVHAGAVLGSDGYGYVRDPATGEYLQFPQQGKLIIEDDVEIGANTTIDRGALDATVIGRGAKLDNLIHLGHNVIIGENVLIAAQTGISGSTTIGKNAIIGGQVGVGDHAHIGENVILGSQAGVLPGKKLRATGGILWGTPAQPLQHILKELGLLRRLRRASQQEADGES